LQIEVKAMFPLDDKFYTLFLCKKKQSLVLASGIILSYEKALFKSNPISDSLYGQ
jgi:hypothetical protein